MIGRLGPALEAAGLPVDPLQLADVLWLATRSTPAPDAAGTPADEPGSGDGFDGGIGTAAGTAHGGRDPGGDTQRYLLPDRPPAERPADTTEVRLPAPPALHGKLGLANALRALKVRRRVAPRRELDVDATVRRYGETGVLIPTVRPALERWFDLTLVVDASPTMDVWQPTVGELSRLLAHHGAFRRLTRWCMHDRDGEVALYSEAGVRRRLDHPGEDTGRQIVVVVSDCVGPQWYRREVWDAVQDWGRRGPVVLAQVLPHRLWEATGVGRIDVGLSGYRPGQPNRGLRVELPWWWPTQDPPSGVVPVVSLADADLARWAHMVIGAAGHPVPGVITDGPWRGDPGTAPEPQGLTAPARLHQFRATVSTEAYELAVCLAAVPIRLPIVRAVQHGVLHSTDRTHLAEVFAGGLIERLTPPGARIPPDAVEYEFAPGVRELLQQSLTGDRTLDTFRAVARYLESSLGRDVSFTALLGGDTRGDADADPRLRPFAVIGAPLLQRLGLGTAPPPAIPAAEALALRPVDGIVEHDVPPTVRMHVGAEALVVIVGSGEHQAGEGWTLAGPGFDALRFAQFFLDRGVPADRIQVLTTPLVPAGTVPDGVRSRLADRTTVREVFMRELPAVGATDLYVVWGGRGFLDADGRWRLTYADIIDADADADSEADADTDADTIDLDFASLLAAYASGIADGLSRQLWLFDVLQMPNDDGRVDVRGHETFPIGEPATGLHQYALLAARRGPGTGDPRTGRFGRELLRLLEADEQLLAEPALLFDAVHVRFTELRATGPTGQTPTYMWYRNDIGDEGQLLRDARYPAAPPGESVAANLPLPVIATIVDALLDIPEFRYPAVREEMLSLLRGPIRAVIRRHDTLRADAISIVRTCSRFQGGISELVEAVRFFAAESPATERLAIVVAAQ
ncbi:SAV_2336 N-terminal domain-related protein [Dactylosporangium siamense]|uniref:Effector-associated domain-containing protein n=1 Tax=Dactylosporangium siamense TaxID=685454 RepID=A0A919UC37_9ACTN|nr:SAV_2336 N-terminal domain-related protein [Dactylosporangium siamense]GIG49917.1 hypothetical protein Dsi01nite_079580 [Dactylosporangium siamense]